MVRAGSSRSLAETSGNGCRKVRKGAVTRRDDESRSVGRSAGSCAPCRMARLEGHHRYGTAARERGPGGDVVDRVAVDGHRYFSPARPDPAAAPCGGMAKAPKSRSQTAGAAAATVRLSHRAAPASGAGARQAHGPAGEPGRPSGQGGSCCTRLPAWRPVAPGLRFATARLAWPRCRRTCSRMRAGPSSSSYPAGSAPARRPRPAGRWAGRYDSRQRRGAAAG